MVDKNSHSSPITLDDEYTEAIQPVIDNNMRTDVLGPHFCKVLEIHKPASEALVALITNEIASDPALKQAIKLVVDERNNETKMKWFDRALGAVGAIILALIIWGIQYLVTHPTTTPGP